MAIGCGLVDRNVFCGILFPEVVEILEQGNNGQPCWILYLCVRPYFLYIEQVEEPDYDSDGDVIVRRRGEEGEGVLLLEHDLSTPLQEVGKQVPTDLSIPFSFILSCSM